MAEDLHPMIRATLAAFPGARIVAIDPAYTTARNIPPEDRPDWLAQRLAAIDRGDWSHLEAGKAT